MDRQTQEKLEYDLLTIHLGQYGYSIVPAQCDDRFYKFTIRKNRK